MPVPGNLLNNGDVESGLMPWVGRGAGQVARNATVFRSASHSVLVSDRTASWHGAAYPIEYLTPGNTYEFSAWVQLAAGETATKAKLTVQLLDGAGTRYVSVGSVAATSNGWSMIEGSYTHSPSGAVEDLIVYVEADSASARFYVDDLAMTGTIVPPPLPPSGADITVDTDISYQTIDGFGAALPMWVGSTAGMLNADEVRKLVGMGENELGLSILRTMIGPNSDTWSFAVANLQEAKSYGSEVQILGSPWSPPGHMKSNGMTANGGKLLLDYYDDYAYHLNGFVQYMDGQGVAVDVVSVQNEPDWHPDYDSCDWTGNELRNFVRDHGGKIQNTKLLVGESLRFNRDYTDPTLLDNAALANIDYVGGHLYSAESTGYFTRYPLAEEKRKGRWMTEWLSHEADGDGAAIWGTPDNQAVWDETTDTLLRSVHRSMDVNWNAYIWWWARRYYSFLGDGDAKFGTTRGEILKRGWAFSHYAKFVRPGYLRVDAQKSTKANGLEVTAFQGDNQIVLVILNRQNSAVNDLVLAIPPQIKAAQFYYTSRFRNREPMDVNYDGQKATVDVGARSISTVVLAY